MIYFLRLFVAYRRLEAQLREEAGRRVFLEDKNRSLVVQVELLEGKELAAKNETIEALKRIADFVTRNTTGKTIFGSVVEEIQIGPKPEPSLRQTATMRTVVRQQTAEFEASETERLRQFYAQS